MSVFISIIIPTCNRNDLLSNCLDQLNPSIQGIIKDNYEIIVTDDSKDNIAKVLIEEKYNWVKWIEGPKKGPAANRNNGAKQAQADWLVFLDDDCLPQIGWLAAYVIAINNSNGIQVFEGATNAERPKERFDEEAPINMNGDNLWSCNFAIKKALFNLVSGFDETFPYAAMEDIDFYVRVKQVASIMFVPEAFIVHPWRRIKPFKSFKKHLMSHKHFAKKHNLLSFEFRISRLKIFLSRVFHDFKALISFSMKGGFFYIENCLINLCLIFI